jgi:uncharacterized protein YndB with AHSA1/START domain
MTDVRIEAERTIDAAVERVYPCIADYRQHHPKWLPSAFSNLVVEEGGIGAGTVVRFDLRLGGPARHFRARIDEPEPGRLLRETSLGTPSVTTFEVVPDGDRSRVRITTDWMPAGGLQGMIERLVAPTMLRRLYRQELDGLDRYVRVTRART